ncbi:MAG: exodeoxyribonuclease VII large subunit [Alphaproteobacteria bacterium]|nr:MAG: exodeoxyribonuclease VII large subunit [Alphaproteobacteria bacterium]
MADPAFQNSPSNIPEFTVSEIAHAVKRVVEGSFERVRVRGEISGLSRPASGHVYFKLKDADAVLDGVCWKFSVPRLKIKPEDGMEIIATGKVSTYPGGSRYQIIVDSIELAGQGALLKLLEERKKKLAAEGLFDPERKKKLPFLPRVIGVVTSPTGAVIRDILHRLADRFPRDVLVWPVPVQGDGAAAQIAAAITGFDTKLPENGIPKPDVLIVARGGGSIEDLWEFNDESVVRAVANCSIPVISAVGHETDVTLIDYVADVRAPTPTAAAELAVPVRLQLIAAMADKTARLQNAIAKFLQLHKKHLQSLSRGLPHPRERLAMMQQKLDERVLRLSKSVAAFLHARNLRLHKIHISPELLRLDLRRQGQQIKQSEARLRQAIIRHLQRAKDQFSKQTRLLQTLSYERVLERGFALMLDQNGQAVTKIDAVNVGEDYRIRLHDGESTATIKDKKRK